MKILSENVDITTISENDEYQTENVKVYFKPSTRVNLAIAKFGDNIAILNDDTLSNELKGEALVTKLADILAVAYAKKTGNHLIQNETTHQEALGEGWPYDLAFKFLSEEQLTHGVPANLFHFLDTLADGKLSGLLSNQTTND